MLMPVLPLQLGRIHEKRASFSSLCSQTGLLRTDIERSPNDATELHQQGPLLHAQELPNQGTWTQRAPSKPHADAPGVRMCSSMGKVPARHVAGCGCMCIEQRSAETQWKRGCPGGCIANSAMVIGGCPAVLRSAGSGRNENVSQNPRCGQAQLYATGEVTSILRLWKIHGLRPVIGSWNSEAGIVIAAHI